MLKKFVKRFLPHPKEILKNRYLKMFGERLYSPEYWAFTPHSTSTGFGVGVFACWIPMPFQSVLAAALALLTRGNLIIAIGSVWISNPFTVGPMLYLAYRIGHKVLGLTNSPFSSMAELKHELMHPQEIALPILLGTVICGIISGLLAYISLRITYKVSHKFT